MVPIFMEDNIVALSTPAGSGALAVVRATGPTIISVVERHFTGFSQKKIASHQLYYGKIYKDTRQQVIDDAVVGIFLGPHSYTGQDTIEISCHGSKFIVNELLQLFVSEGVRIATPGEFTRRAFANGKLDLTQAEAVADLIAAENKQSHDIAIYQMRGGFSKEINSLRQQLIDFAALIELELDFGEEDVTFADRDQLTFLVTNIIEVIDRLVQSFEWGNVLKNGIQTSIVGRPNAGKSTLLNALLNEDRAIVSEIEGTTRDTIEEVVHINDILFRLIDTAGIRSADNAIEQMGISRTYDTIKKAALVLYVFDVSRTSAEQLQHEIEGIVAQNPSVKILAVANKMDLNPYQTTEALANANLPAHHIVPIIAKENANLGYLKEKMIEVLALPELSDHQTIVTNARHIEALQQTKKSLLAVIHGLENGTSSDFVAMDIRAALHHLGEITGTISSENLLDSIFFRFCIGK